MIPITDAEKIELATLAEPVVRRHESEFLGAAFADLSCHYAQWREAWRSHQEALWDVHLLLKHWWDDTFPYEEPALRAIHPVGTGWADDHGGAWIWRGSTDFRLPERVGAGVDIAPILQDRKSCGANLVRMLAMKWNNTGWAFDPRRPDHTDVMRRTFDALATARMYGEWTVFADTRKYGMGNPEQDEFYDRNQLVVREYPFLFLELVNEADHATQQVDPSRFQKPLGIISSHGSKTTDKQPVQPFWDFATAHTRRFTTTVPYPSPKPGSNYDMYEYRGGDPFPLPCPFISDEGPKPQTYQFNVAYARFMGQQAAAVAGGTFHHDAWNECRPFTDQERVCALAFYQGLGV